MASLDDLLRDLEQQHRATSKPDNPLDQALEALQQEHQTRKKPSQRESQPQGDRLAEMLAALEQETVANKLKDCEKNQRLYQEINQLIAAKQNQAQRPLPQTDLKAIAAAEKQKQMQEKYWRTKAETWLKELDPLSNEGLWFMEFAKSYDDPLTAAIEYLQALE